MAHDESTPVHRCVMPQVIRMPHVLRICDRQWHSILMCILNAVLLDADGKVYVSTTGALTD